MLHAHALVREAVVVVVRADGREPRLIAAYTADAPCHPELAAFVRERLPSFMVPRRYHHLAALPRTGNGKIDRRRLAEQLASAG